MGGNRLREGKVGGGAERGWEEEEVEGRKKSREREKRDKERRWKEYLNRAGVAKAEEKYRIGTWKRRWRECVWRAGVN